MEERNLNVGKGRWGREEERERSRRLNREEIECSSNIEEDSGFARIEGRNVSIRPLLDSSGVHRLPLAWSTRHDQRFSFVVVVLDNTRGKFTYDKYG